jgi:hypothetical protein
MLEDPTTPGQMPVNSLIPAPHAPPAHWWVGTPIPVEQPSHDFSADIRLPRADRVTRALLNAIF